jgi:hypothetical protein
MQAGHLKEIKKTGTKSIKIDLKVLFFEEEKIYYAYMPSLDVTGYGKTDEAAKESHSIVVAEFLRYTISKNTLFIEMQRLGWKIKSKKKPMHAPPLSDLINTNDQLREIVNSKQYKIVNYPVYSS